MWKHQLPSIFCRNQPTGGSYLSQLQLTSIKLQLDREAPTSLLFQKKNTCWFTLDISSVLYLLFCCSTILISVLISFLHLLRFTISFSFFFAQLLLLLCLTTSFLHSLTFHGISFCSSFFLSSLPQFHTLHSLYSLSLTSCSFLIFFNSLQFCCTLSSSLTLFSSPSPFGYYPILYKIASWLFVFVSMNPLSKCTKKDHFSYA